MKLATLDAVPAPERERKQQQRPLLGIGRDHEEGTKAFAHPDLALPGCEEIKTLIGGVGALALFELAPDRLGLAEIAHNIDGGDAARLRPVVRLRRPAFDRGSHGHRDTC